MSYHSQFRQASSVAWNLACLQTVKCSTLAVYSISMDATFYIPKYTAIWRRRRYDTVLSTYWRCGWHSICWYCGEDSRQLYDSFGLRGAGSTLRDCWHIQKTRFGALDAPALQYCTLRLPSLLWHSICWYCVGDSGWLYDSFGLRSAGSTLHDCWRIRKKTLRRIRRYDICQHARDWLMLQGLSIGRKWTTNVRCWR